MNITNGIFNIIKFLKPLLIKIVPINYLRMAKKKYIGYNTKKLSNAGVESFISQKYEKGINLIGNIRLDSGLGQSMRLLANVLNASEIPYTIVEHHITDGYSMTDRTFDYKISDNQKYNVNIIHINPHEYTIAYMQLGKKIWDFRYNIAYWLWEMEEFPAEWIDCIGTLDEIWTPAEFISSAVRKVTDKPVITVPYCVKAPIKEEYNRRYFKLPENKFLYLMVYDSGSMTERKNPQGVIEAFKKAFKKDDCNVGLVIKINGKAEDDIENIRKILDGYESIYFITETLSKLEVNSLINCADVVVSLHRAEGFGLVLAEAMLNKVPCIATNWSANTEFMNGNVACMVGYTLVKLERDIGPYKKGNRWAEPNIEEAAQYMVQLYEDKSFYDEKSEKAYQYVSEVLSEKRVIKIIKERFKKIVC